MSELNKLCRLVDALVMREVREQLSEETINDRMRRSTPRKIDLATLTNDRFVRFVQTYNDAPRKCLDFQTPARLFSNNI